MSAQQITLRAAVRFLFLTLLMLAGYLLFHVIAIAPFLVVGL